MEWLDSAPASDGAGDEEQNDRADEGHDRAADPATVGVAQKHVEHPAAEQCADEADDQVAEGAAGAFAGTTALASAPAMMPTMIQKMICIFLFSRVTLDIRSVPGSILRASLEFWFLVQQGHALTLCIYPLETFC